jgi:hypothetical protein
LSFLPNELFVLGVALVFLVIGYFMGRRKTETESVFSNFTDQGSKEEPQGDLFNDQLQDLEDGERVDTIK